MLTDTVPVLWLARRARVVSLLCALVSCSPQSPLDRAIEKQEYDEEIDLSGAALIELPERLPELDEIKKLDVSYNRLARLPANIGWMQQLSALNASHNNIARLPESTYYLRSLVDLDLSYNRLEHPPYWILGGEARLTSLNLRENRLKYFPFERFNLENLEELDLSSNPLEELDSAVAGAGHLRTLYLQDTKLRTLPPEIGSLPNLRTLYLGTHIESLPEEFGNLNSLELFSICGGRLVEGPDSIYFEHSRNAFKALPRSFRKLPKLKGLAICGARLDKNRVFLGGLDSLNLLHLPFNGLTRAPGGLRSLKNLRYLTLRDNTLKAVPDGIGDLKRLEMLDLRNNQIEELPEELGDLVNLRRIYLDGNRIKDLTILSRLDSLVLISATNNSIRSWRDLPIQLREERWKGNARLNGNPISGKWDREDSAGNQIQDFLRKFLWRGIALFIGFLLVLLGLRVLSEDAEKHLHDRLLHLSGRVREAGAAAETRIAVVSSRLALGVVRTLSWLVGYRPDAGILMGAVPFAFCGLATNALVTLLNPYVPLPAGMTRHHLYLVLPAMVGVCLALGVLSTRGRILRVLSTIMLCSWLGLV